MSRGKWNKPPKYRQHKSGLAVVTVNGRSVYLGKYGSAESLEKYSRVIAEISAECLDCPESPQYPQSPEDVTVAVVIAMYLRHAQTYYHKGDENYKLGIAVKPLLKLYKSIPAVDFGPAKLDSVREHIIKSARYNWNRKTINDNIKRMIRPFKFAAGKELISIKIYNELAAMEPIRKNRDPRVRESKKVQPVKWADVEAIKPYVSPTIWAMVQLQWHTGMRGDEIFQMRTCDIEIKGDIWLYRPEHSKTEHHDYERVVAIGPKGQEILKQWLRTDTEAFLFQPGEAEAERQAKRKSQRKTPRWPSHATEVRRKQRGTRKRTFRPCYNKNSYRVAIHRGIKKFNLKNTESEIKLWSPHQLRHAFGTRARAVFEPDHVRTSLGHTSVDTTLIYAEQDVRKATEVARKMG